MFLLLILRARVSVKLFNLFFENDATQKRTCLTPLAPRNLKFIFQSI
ncbi:hypothetical protein THERMOS_373 [Bathymodiolus thermophilus thioautotrophic gill symbiont]|uniref:Uncharacterized protein n=1 Tax=Bathymodiolus thermophilus thioautotrophic gill symbiont TaxID=2360 RepID=A0A8H8XBD1_9GAMM|nr:hypothetical protein THERMOS_373 [Bathymodiolus thermophilus thioautotrophic gill symbiont]